jgi:hypothetical protein
VLLNVVTFTSVNGKFTMGKIKSYIGFKVATMTWIISNSNSMSTTSETGTAYPFRAPEFIN